MARLPGGDRAPAYRPAPGEREQEQARDVVRLERRGQPAHQVEQRAQLLNLLVEALVEPVRLLVGARVGDAARCDAEQRVEELDLLAADRPARRAADPEQPDRVLLRANRQDQLDAREARLTLVECFPGLELRHPAHEREAHLAALRDRDQPAPDQQAAHDRAEQVAQEFVEVERGVEQLRGLEQRFQPGCSE